METSAAIEEKRFEYGMRRHYLNGRGNPLGDYKYPRYTLEPPTWAQSKVQVNSRLRSDPSLRSARYSVTSRDEAQRGSMKLPSIGKNKESNDPTSFNSDKLAGIMMLLGSANKRQEAKNALQSSMDDASRRVQEAKQAKALMEGKLTRDQVSLMPTDMGRWETCVQAGVTFWLNSETGEAAMDSPFAAKHAKDVMLARHRRKSNAPKGPTELAEPMLAPAGVQGTGSLVYDTGPFSELMNMLDSQGQPCTAVAMGGALNS